MKTQGKASKKRQAQKTVLHFRGLGGELPTWGKGRGEPLPFRGIVGYNVLKVKASKRPDPRGVGGLLLLQ